MLLKKILFYLMILTASTTLVFGQTMDYLDVVYLKNGSILRGIIIENIPGKLIKIETLCRNVFVFKYASIKEITQEPIKLSNHSVPSQGQSEEQNLIQSHTDTQHRSSNTALSILYAYGGSNFFHVVNSSWSVSYAGYTGSGDSKIFFNGTTADYSMFGLGLLTGAKNGSKATRIAFIYMPRQTMEYNKMKSDNSDDWQEFPDSYKIDFILYQLTFTRMYRIKLVSNFHILLGLGFGAGILNTPPRSEEAKNYSHLAGTIFPVGGFEVFISRNLSLFSEYHHQWGITTFVSESSGYGDANWGYLLNAFRIAAGVNLYY